MIERFYENEKDIYIILYNSMKSIDAPKTLVFPSKADMKAIDEKYFKKSHFLKYTERRENVKESDYKYTYSLLDRFSDKIQKELLNTIEARNKKFRNRCDIIQKKFKNEEYHSFLIDVCLDEVNQLYRDYTNKKNEINKRYKEHINSSKRIQREFNVEIDFTEIKKVRNNDYKDLDKEFTPKAERLLVDYDMATICQAISMMKNCTEDFILNLLWRCFTYINNPNKARFIYVKDDEGDVEYLHEKYKTIAVTGFDNENAIERIAVERDLRNNLYKRVRFRIQDKSIIKEIEEAIRENRVYSLNLNDSRIKLFDDFKHIARDKEILRVLDFDKNKLGKNSINKNSMGLIIEA